MIKKELAEKLSVLVYLQKQTRCQQKKSLMIQKLDKDIRININTQFEAINGPCPASLVQNLDNSINDIIKIEVWFWV